MKHRSTWPTSEYKQNSAQSAQTAPKVPTYSTISASLAVLTATRSQSTAMALLFALNVTSTSCWCLIKAGGNAFVLKATILLSLLNNAKDALTIVSAVMLPNVSLAIQIHPQHWGFITRGHADANAQPLVQMGWGYMMIWQAKGRYVLLVIPDARLAEVEMSTSVWLAPRPNLESLWADTAPAIPTSLRFQVPQVS